MKHLDTEAAIQRAIMRVAEGREYRDAANELRRIEELMKRGYETQGPLEARKA